MVESFKSTLQKADSEESRELMRIPSMNRKAAQVLVENHVSSLGQFLELSPEQIAQYFQLNIVFEVSELQQIELMEENDDLSIRTKRYDKAPDESHNSIQTK